MHDESEHRRKTEQYGGAVIGDEVRSAMGQEIPNRDSPMFSPEQTAEYANQIFPPAMGNAAQGARVFGSSGSGATPRAGLGRSQIPTSRLEEGIAGHAVARGRLEQGKNGFREVGISNHAELAGHVRNVMNNPSATRELSNGRTAYWDNRTGTLVIRNPRDVDGGTTFRPNTGFRYFERLE